MNKEIKKKKLKKIFTLMLIIGIFAFFTPVVFAAESDPISVVNNLSDFVFELTKVIGGIIVGYAIVQIGLSFTNHDASQRVSGFLFFAGGVIIMCAKVILNKILGG